MYIIHDRPTYNTYINIIISSSINNIIILLYHNLILKSIITPIMEHWRAHYKSNKAETI